MRRAEPRPVGFRRADPPPPRFELDRRWLLRGILAAVFFAFLLLITKASMMAFGNGSQRMERHERIAESAAGAQAAPVKPLSVP